MLKQLGTILCMKQVNVTMMKSHTRSCDNLAYEGVLVDYLKFHLYLYSLSITDVVFLSDYLEESWTHTTTCLDFSRASGQQKSNSRGLLDPSVAPLLCYS